MRTAYLLGESLALLYSLGLACREGLIATVFELETLP